MAKFRITAPSPVTGSVLSIAFANGEGVADERDHRAQLSYFRRHGYAVERIGEPEPETPAVEEDEDDEPFNPDEHDAKDVIAYLDSLEEDDDEERERVLAAEAEGKNRKTIMEKGAAS